MPLSYIQLFGMSTDENLKEFNKYSLFVETMFYSNLPKKIKLDSVRKIVIELLDKDLYGDSILEIIGSNKSPICTLRKSFDFSNFLKESSSLDKKKKLTAELYNDLQKLSQELKWDEAPFNQAYENTVRSNFESSMVLGKIKSTKNKKNQASVIIHQELGVATVVVIFFNSKQEEIKKVEIFKTLPQPIIYGQLVGDSRWINDIDFELINNSGEIHIVVSMLKDTPTVFFTPKGREVDGIIEELNFLLQGNLPSWLKGITQS